MPDLSTHTGPRYQAIAEAISDAIDRGALTPGDRLPPQRDLAYRLGVTVGTVSRGYMLAEQQGLVGGEVGRGTYVRPRRETGDGPLVPPPDDIAVDLGINMATSRTHADALSKTLREIADAPGVANLLRYMPAAGHPLHRASGAEWVSRVGLDVTPDQVYLTQGTQQALGTVFEVLGRPSGSVLAEAVTYSGVIENARLKEVALEPVALDGDGMVPEALDAAAERSKARVVIVVPTVQNPTATVMSEPRRREIVRVAEKHDLTIVEDDVYGFLLPDRPPPIASFAPERTVYMTSASKCLAPGLRVGWMVGPERLMNPFLDSVYAHSVAQPALNHEIIRRWIEDGTADRLIESLRREIAARQEIARDTLAEFAVGLAPTSFHLLLDLPAPWRREEFVAAALERGIRVTSLSSFAIEPNAAPESVRVSLAAAADCETLGRALRTLRDLANAGPRASRAVV